MGEKICWTITQDRVFFFYIKIKMFHLSKAFTSHFHYTLSKSYALSFDHTDTVIRP